MDSRFQIITFIRSKFALSLFLFIILNSCKENPVEPTKSELATRDDNLALGNPSNANNIDETNYLLTKSQYVVSYIINSL